MTRSWPTFSGLVLALLVVAATPALAAAAEGHEQKPDIFLPPRFDLTIWTIVVFCALLFVLRKFAWKPMLDGLQSREARIHGAHEEAQTALADAQKLRNELQVERGKIHEEHRNMIEEARRDAQQVSDKLLAEARDKIQADTERAHREIEMASTQARQQLRSETARLAALVSAKAIGRSLTPEDHRGLVDEAVAELHAASTRA
jgi:F-type H+-transporting ATPase subunit b